MNFATIPGIQVIAGERLGVYIAFIIKIPRDEKYENNYCNTDGFVTIGSNSAG